MKLGTLIKTLQELQLPQGDEGYDIMELEVETEGCDCIGDVAQVEVTGYPRTILLRRSE